MRHQLARILFVRADDNLTILIELLRQVGPPLLVGFAQFLNHFRIRIGDIVLLAGVGLYIIKLFAIDQPPPLSHDRTLAPLFRMFNPLRVNKQRAVKPPDALALQQRHKAGAVKFHAARFLQPAQLDQCRQHVDVGRQPVNIAPAANSAAGPANKERHSVPAVILRALGSSHAGVEAFAPAESCGRSVVSHKDKNSVLFKTQCL